MVTKSKADLTLFFCNLLLFSIFAFAFSIPFWGTDFFDKVVNNSTQHILLALGYLLLFIFLPLFALSWSTTIFVVYEGKIKVINWFGIKRKVYLLPFSKNLIVKKETAPYSFRFFPINSRYNEYQTLHLSTVEEHRLRI